MSTVGIWTSVTPCRKSGTSDGGGGERDGRRGWRRAKQRSGNLLLGRKTRWWGESELLGSAQPPGDGGGGGAEERERRRAGGGARCWCRSQGSARAQQRASASTSGVEDETQIPPHTTGGSTSAARACGMAVAKARPTPDGVPAVSD
jgi:hypothetical protein